MPSPSLLDRLAALDRAAFHALNVDGGRALDAAARLLSSHAFGIAWGLAVAFALVVRLRRDAVPGVLAIGLAVAASDRLGDAILRPLFGRVRPPYALPPDEVRRLLRAADAGSLPSLHASNLFAIATAATLADRRLGLVAYSVAAAVAWSRVYGGVHWPGDVLAGALWGALAALAAWAVARRVIRPRGAAPGGPTS
jgi:undecaprenyl-diphosphatase